MAELLSVYLQLFFEFFKAGLFAVGGGMATFPFLKEMGERTGWFTNGDLMNMLAVSESTPGPIGINMATYVGFTVGSRFSGGFGGVLGGIIATLGEITPSIIIIIIVASMLRKFRDNVYVDRAFYGLRPASAGLIAAAALGIIVSVMLPTGQIREIFLPGLILAVILFVLMNFVKFTKKLHPIVFIAASAVIGIIFKW